MSLDVYLTIGEAQPSEGSGIFVRENGQTKEISRQEWDEKFPDREPLVVQHGETDQVYSANITHNLNLMAEKAGLYNPLWQPNENGMFRAADLIDPIEFGLAKLRGNPKKFKRYNPSNGWGDYDGLVQFAEEYLAACKKFPAAAVTTWR